jgi:hypothetical protein
VGRIENTVLMCNSNSHDKCVCRLVNVREKNMVYLCEARKHLKSLCFLNVFIATESLSSEQSNGVGP